MVRAWAPALLSSLVCCPLLLGSSPAWCQTFTDLEARGRPPVVWGAPPPGDSAASDSSALPSETPSNGGARVSTEPGVGADPGAAPSPPPPSDYEFPTAGERLKDWALNAFGPTAVAGSVTSAAWGQWVSNEPREWPGSREGFAKRFGVASATTAITETSLSLLSAASRQDVHYYRCPCTGLGPRVLYAIKTTFMARRPDGSAVFSAPKTMSPFVGPLVTRNTLYPARYTYADGALSGAYALLMNVGWSLAYEFVLRPPAW